MMCEYGNCNETDNLHVLVSVDGGEYRKRFCCEHHAALWLLKLSERRNWTDEQRALIRQVTEDAAKRLGADSRRES